MKHKTRSIRAEVTTWEKLQKIADKSERGNLNHLVNKIFDEYLKKQK